MESVEHVRPDEVLLARQRGVIAGKPQVVRHRRRRGGEFRAIVEGSHARRQHPGQHREARRGAEREIAVGVLEHHAFVAQSIEVRRDRRAAVRGQHLGLELICLNEQDVRSVVGHGMSPEAESGTRGPDRGGVPERTDTIRRPGGQGTRACRVIMACERAGSDTRSPSRPDCTQATPHIPFRSPERCPSGRRSTPGKCVYVNSVPRVRIPPSPPIEFRK